MRKSGVVWNDLNRASAHIQTLGNNIYTKKKFLTNIYLFIVYNRNTRKRSEICSKLIIKTPEFELISHLFLVFYYSIYTTQSR